MTNPKPELLVAPCSYEAAKFAVGHWHYSQRMPKSKLVKYGVWENRNFIGCVIFGRSISPQIGKPFGLNVDEVCELQRVALNSHYAPVTRIVSAAIKLLKQYNEGLRLVVSFADSEQGHLGTIYQAGNWLYVGFVTRGQMMINGRWRNDTAAYRLGGEFETRQSPPKYKYLYPLDRAMRRQIEPLAQPYPKQVNHADA